jgi:hypothetical protein
VVRTITTREPRWTDEDRDEMFALALYRSWLCPLCGGPIDECTSNYETGVQYEVRKKRCRATDERLAAQETDGKVDRPGAVLVSVTKRE